MATEKAPFGASLSATGVVVGLDGAVRVDEREEVETVHAHALEDRLAALDRDRPTLEGRVDHDVRLALTVDRLAHTVVGERQHLDRAAKVVHGVGGGADSRRLETGEAHFVILSFGGNLFSSWLKHAISR